MMSQGAVVPLSPRKGPFLEELARALQTQYAVEVHRLKIETCSLVIVKWKRDISNMVYIYAE